MRQFISEEHIGLVDSLTFPVSCVHVTQLENVAL